MEASKNGFSPHLNPIRTHPVRPDENSSDDSPAKKMGPIFDASKLGRGGRGRNRKGRRKANKIARWFSSYFTRSQNKAMNPMPYKTKFNRSGTTMHNKNEVIVAELTKDEASKSGMRVKPEGNITKKVGLSKKSFSHELGRNAGLNPAIFRTYSYRDLKELVGSFHLMFDAAKESVNAQLDTLTLDMIDALEQNSLSEDKIRAEKLLSLIQHCTKMTSYEFHEGCERIVKDLAEMRHQCLYSPLRHFITRMLLILTRCTRLLQIQKDSEKMNEASLDKFKEFLDSVPAVDITQLPKPSSELNCFFNNHLDNNESMQIAIQSSEGIAESTTVSSDYLPNNSHGEAISNESCNPQHEHPTYYDKSDSVICRICEDDVPASHWKFHSYICACADHCDLDGLDIDERLLKIAELLEHFVEFYNNSPQASCSSPEISGTESVSSAFGSEPYSPKLQDWQSKDMEGMFEDIHEIDTACLDNMNITAADNLRRALAMKLGASLTASSNGSMTPSTTTPRSSQLDSFWLEHSSCTDFEDPDKMIEIAYIARKAASINLTSDQAPNLLNNQLNELEDILRQSQLKALIIDTFGSRTKHLLEEKQLLAVELPPKERDTSNVHHEQVNSSSNIEELHLSTSAPSYKDRTTIDDFDIIKPISRGAFGKVFLAQKRTTRDLFAIKVLKKMDMIRKNDAERILAERAILIKVRNPFVVRFFYSFTSRDNLYLVMEYLNGGDLFSLLRKVGCLEEDIAKTYIAELVLALEYLHSLGIVHRDLKPDNILIGHDGHIKLTDFGLSKIGLLDSAMELSISGTTGLTTLGSENQYHLSSDAHQRSKRSRRSAVGTPDYLAPEILLGTAHGFAADWWSVGIILFELITGIPPFSDRLPEMIFNNILNRKIPWPHVPSDMSYEAKDLIDRFLTQDQNLRLGANGAFEVKDHCFFKDVDWDNLALRKAAFVPQPDSADDTSYFTSRYSQEIPVYKEFCDCSDAFTSNIGSLIEKKVVKKNEIWESESGNLLDLLSTKFSFKNRNQLASMTYDVLLQNGKTSNCSSPSRGPHVEID